MLVKHHVLLSAAAALIAAPVVKRKSNLVLFVAAAVGQDVDHYLWYAVKFRNPSLRAAYRFFRSRYGTSPKKSGLENSRALHGVVPLTLAAAAATIERRLWPVVLGMAFHGVMDALNEYILMPNVYEDYDSSDVPGARPAWPLDGKAGTSEEPRELAEVR